MYFSHYFEKKIINFTKTDIIKQTSRDEICVSPGNYWSVVIHSGRNHICGYHSLHYYRNSTRNLFAKCMPSSSAELINL